MTSENPNKAVIHRTNAGCRVDPAVCLARVGEPVCFRAPSVDAELYLPVPDMWNPSTSIARVARGSEKCLTLADRPGAYDYAVTCRRRQVITLLDDEDNRFETVEECVQFAQDRAP